MPMTNIDIIPLITIGYKISRVGPIGLKSGKHGPAGGNIYPPV
jgi:hypothetical protein